MANQPGYFPDYFENVAGPLYDGADIPPPGDPWDDADTPTDAVAPVPLDPAPWIDSTPFLLDEDTPTTAVDVAFDASDLLDPGAIEIDIDQELVDFVIRPRRRDRRLVLSPDVIAVYRPWHLHGPDWGIYVSGPALAVFAGALADLTGSPVGQLAPLALRQILEHEWTHFAFEVAATEVEDVAGRLLYPQYVRQRFARPGTHSAGPSEEIVASWVEVEFARNPPSGFRRMRPRGYKRAVEHLLSLAPPGYSEYHVMSDWDMAVETVAEVMSLIADRPMTTWRWGRLDEEEKEQVPVYWLGDAATAAAFGAFPKSVGPPAIKRVQKWLSRVMKAKQLPGRGKGSHERWELPDGTRIGFATSAGFLLAPEAKELADVLGITRQQLFDCIGRMVPVGS